MTDIAANMLRCWVCGRQCRSWAGYVLHFRSQHGGY